MASDDLQGKTAVITGASSGIGEATARTLAAQGANVALLARRVDRVERLAEELGGGGDAVKAIEEDVADVIVFAVAQPARTSLNEILIRPPKQAL